MGGHSTSDQYTRDISNPVTQIKQYLYEAAVPMENDKFYSLTGTRI
jgi:hypothetical protein